MDFLQNVITQLNLHKVSMLFYVVLRWIKNKFIHCTVKQQGAFYEILFIYLNSSLDNITVHDSARKEQIHSCLVVCNFLSRIFRILKIGPLGAKLVIFKLKIREGIISNDQHHFGCCFGVSKHEIPQKLV